LLKVSCSGKIAMQQNHEPPCDTSLEYVRIPTRPNPVESSTEMRAAKAGTCRGGCG
jgi:hypothetical protein